MFDADRPPAPPIPAASVILCRAAAPGPDGRPAVEVFLLRRHRRSSFMSDAFVFPGGKVDPTDGDAAVAALRELFEEAGVLVARPRTGHTVPDAGALAEHRRRLLADELTFPAFLDAAGLEPDGARLHAWSHWITPSAEPKRFSAHFFLCELPPGQTPSFDARETVEELWIRPADALERQAAGTLKLPPPQVFTLRELDRVLAAAPAGTAPLARLAEAAAARAEAPPHPILPRFAQPDGQVALLLPWDPEYETAGTGESRPFPPGHPLASGPSRFLLEGMTWRLTYAPGSLVAG